jgi:uncharacterized protein YjbI with pentapeptide repeats
VAATGAARMSKGVFDVLNTLAQLVVAVATVIALFKISDQTELSRAQLKLQKETSDRSWTAELLARAYDGNAHRYVREETVRAYILVQRDLNKQVRLPQANLEDMNLGEDDQYLKEADFTSTRMRAINLEGGKLQGAKFNGADLSNASFRNADLTGADFSTATLYWTDFSGSTLVNVDFKGANFAQLSQGTGDPTGNVVARGANFSGAMFDEYTKLCQIDLSSAKLADAKGLTQQHLSCAITDESTTLPQGLHPPKAGDCHCL